MTESGSGLGGRLQQALREAGMTEGQLAQGDLTPVYIQMIARGQIRPSLEVLEPLARRLRKPLSYFLEGLPGSRADILLLVNLAVGYLEQKDTPAALPLLLQAERFAAEQQDPRIQGRVQMQLCRLARLEGDLDEAQRRGTRALKLLQNAGEPAEISQAMMYLGNVAWVRRNLYEALARYQDALVVGRGCGDQELLSRVHQNLGNTYIWLEDWASADRHLRTAIDLASGQDAERHGRLQMNLALAYRDKGDLDRALELSVKALTCFGRGKKDARLANLYINIGTIHVLAGDRDKARECFNGALGILGTRPVRQVAEAQRELARLAIEEGDVAGACSCAEGALECARDVGDRTEYGKCALVYAQALLGAGRASEAVEHLRTAHEIFLEVGLRQSLAVAQDLMTQVESTLGKGVCL